MTPREALRDAEACTQGPEERAVLYLRAIAHLAFAVATCKFYEAVVDRKTADD